MRPRPPSPSLFPYTTLFRSGFLAALPPLDGVHRLVAGAHLRDHRLLLRADPGLGAELHGVLGRRALGRRSEEHTSELQSRGHLVCRLLLDKKIERSIE